MDIKRVIGVGLVLGLFVLLGIFGLSEEFPPDFDFPEQPAFPGAEPAGQPAFEQLPSQPTFPGQQPGAPSPQPRIPPVQAQPPSPPAGAVPPALPGDISGPNGVPDGQCVNLYDIWAMGPQVGVCQLPAGSPLDVDGDGCFTEADLPTIMQNVNVRCS